jgi:hypothetical protein
MKSHALAVFSLPLLVAGAMAVSAAEPAAATWKAGAAQVNITPEHFMQMSGYGGRGSADGKLIDLWAKALVLDDPSGARAVLITLDLVGIDREVSLAIRGGLKKKYGLGLAAVVLACSHTHTGPVVGNNLNGMFSLQPDGQKLVADYARSLQEKVVTLVGEAIATLAPARLNWGNGQATFAVNRRNNKEADVVKLREAGLLKGPVDHEVPVLAVRDPAGKLRAVVCGYACHATVLSFTKWSGDWPGFAQRRLEQDHPGAVALFWAGCGADQNPLPRRTVAYAEEYGNKLAAAVEAVLAGPMSAVTGRLGVAYREIDLPFAALPSRDQVVQDSTSANKYTRARALLLLREIEKNGTLRGAYPYPVQVWQLGDGPRWVTLGGEVVVDYAVRLKKELGPGTTWVMGYANDVMAYIPSSRVLKEGGYEGGGAMVYYGLPSVWGPRVEELIVSAVRDEAAKMVAPR